jgi:sulfur carrier protein ThiS
VAVKIFYRGQVIEVSAGMPLRDILVMNGIQPESHFGVRDGKVIPDDEILSDGEVIRLVKVISGGA